MRVCIEDPKAYSYVVRELRKRGVPISEKGEISACKSPEDLDAYVGKLVALSMGKEAFDELAIGIDANSRENLTIAVVGDGEILEYGKASIHSLCGEVLRILRMYPHKREVVGVGSGNPLGFEAFVELSKCVNSVRLVDERSTSRKNVFLKGKYIEDVVAAYNIAMRALT